MIHMYIRNIIIYSKTELKHRFREIYISKHGVTHRWVIQLPQRFSKENSRRR